MLLFNVEHSNVSYHGDLEKKAAMEQKRTLTGDEANGHDNSGSGIYHNNSFKPRMRKKPNNRQSRALTNDIMTSSCYEKSSAVKSSSYRVTIVRPLRIPDIFIKKPTPPLKIYRTGKIWSVKRPHAESKKCFRQTVAKSRSYSHLLKERSSSLQKRRHSHLDVPAAGSFPILLPNTIHSLSHFSRKVPCIHCLIDVGCVSSTTRNRLSADRYLTSLLNDFLTTTGFQHIIFC